MTDYTVETLSTWRPDAEPLLERHKQELATYQDIPLDPDWSWYDRAEQLGNLVIYTARQSNLLVGYALFVVISKHPHYKSIAWATNDILWTHPQVRGGGVGTGLADFFEADLKQRFLTLSTSGRGIIQARSKTRSPGLAKMLGARGYQSDEQGHTKLV